MKILLSAYACEPNKGSEPAVGWNWANELSKRNNKVFVITRANNKSNIEKYIYEKKLDQNINFIYYDLPFIFIRIKNIFKCTRIYYILWQIMILKKCRALNLKYNFDIVHHITFVSIRHFSLLGELNVDTIIGPLGGAETSPIWLRKHIGFKGFLSETFRDICNLFTLIDPIFLRSLEKCSKIIFTTRSGEKYLKKKFYKKAIFCPAVGLNQNEYPSIKVSPKKQKRILFVGRHLHWKGMKIGIEAFKEALHKDPKLSLTIVGSGNASKYWKNLTERYKIEKKVEWQPWVSKEKLKEIYKDHGIFLFPSLHDSGGFVVLEAMKYGLPVICLDLGGPADFVDNSSGIVIKTKIKNYKLLLNNLSSAIYYLSNDLISWKSYSIGAQNRAKDFSINNVVQRIYK